MHKNASLYFLKRQKAKRFLFLSFLFFETVRATQTFSNKIRHTL